MLTHVARLLALIPAGSRWRPNHRVAEQMPQHWSIVVIDMAGFGQWTNRTQLRARAVLNTAIRSALHTAGIKPARLVVEDRGDGMVVLVSARFSKVCLIDPMIPALVATIRRHNAGSPTHRIRLKVAVHAGEIHYDGSGWAGADLNLACRLVDSAPLSQHLRDNPDTDLILIVSDLIHSGVIRHGYRRIDPANYRSTRVAVKETDARAWLHVPETRTRAVVAT